MRFILMLGFLLFVFFISCANRETTLPANDNQAAADIDTNELPDEETPELKTWCKDSDKDGFGDPSVTEQAEKAPEGYTDDCSDCDDTSGKINPDAEEIIGDGIDQDCRNGDAKPCADILCDGYPDIVFAMTDRESETAITSYLYTGSASGFSPDRKIELPTVGAMGIDFGDVNKDGYLDIVFASVKKMENGEENRYSESILYYGNALGFDLEHPILFPTVGAADVTIADLDKDGWPDILFPNRYNGTGMTGAGYKINSYVYWGSQTGFNIENKLELPTVGAAKLRVADLNKDGFNDIVVPNGVQEYVGVFDSYIYYAKGPGKDAWGPDNRATIPSVSPETAVVDDINDDGWQDIFISGWLCLTKCDLKNRIYWGSESGFSDTRFTKIDGVDGITEAIFIDLNKDGIKDVVLASGAVDLLTQEFSKESYIIYGVASEGPDKYAWPKEKKVALPATAASEAAVIDLNGDGWLDIVFASHYPPTDTAPEVSQIYWGTPDGYSPASLTEFPTTHAAGMKVIGSYNP